MKFLFPIFVALNSWTVAHATDAWDSQFTRQNISLDLSQVYAWSDNDFLRIVVTVSTQKSPAKILPYTFFSPRGRYVVHVDTDGNLQPDLEFAFYISAKGEVLLQAFEQEWRGILNETIAMESTRAMAGLAKTPEFGDAHSLKQWVLSQKRCIPSAANELRCFPSSRKEPNDDYADMMTGFLSLEIPVSVLKLSNATAKVNVWATTWNKL
jgi:hypothetical protein